MPIDSPVANIAGTRRWRLLRTPPASGAANMALDEALTLRAPRTGEWTLRVYGWATPTLSLGRNQHACDLYDPATLAEAGLGVVRRPTGGRALLHDAEVTYSVTGPLDDAASLRSTYARINAIIVDALRAVGVEASIVSAEAGRSSPPGATPCFAVPAAGEIVAGGAKLAGSAQWRHGRGLLQHGSILLDGDQAMVAALQRTPLPAPPAPATIAGLRGGAVGADDVADALFAAVCSREDPGATALDLDEATLADTRRLFARYADAAWTWQR